MKLYLWFSESAQHHALFKLLKSWEKEIDKHCFVGTVLMDLSKAYDCIFHELRIVILHSYGVTSNSQLPQQT